MDLLEIDGTRGEGGGQILRTALSLSVITGIPFRMVRIRGKRRKPGLRRQHLVSLQAARQVGGGRAVGAQEGSQEVTFYPGRPRPGRYRFEVGTAGSALLVLQTILPPLFSAGGDSELTLLGGTHNPMAPPFEFAERSFFPLLRGMGFSAEASLIHHGFYPRGGGEIHVRVSQTSQGPQSLRLEDRPSSGGVSGEILLSRLPRHIGDRESRALRQETGVENLRVAIREVPSRGPGNAVFLFEDRGLWHDVFTAFGERGKPAEAVAREAVAAWREHRQATGAVDTHLADQLLIYLALSGSGSFTTGPPSLHATTNMETINLFLPGAIEVDILGDQHTRFRRASSRTADSTDTR